MDTGSAREVGAALGRRIGCQASPAPASRVGGGSISRAWRWETACGALFVKLQPEAALRQFETEATGLAAIAATGTIRVPAVRAVGCAGGQAYLALEWLELVAGDAAAEAMLGEQLAALHGCTGEAFGWPEDNFIGSTPQLNTPHAEWPEFFRDRRLRPQLELARQSGASGLHAAGSRLCERMGAFFGGHRPVASLVHGDLWGGNWAMTREGSPVLFDPAAHRADREVDLAMTRLFGGFGHGFSAAYQAAWPLDHGAARRESLYNLYHVLNHFNLFGGHYARQAERLIGELLADC